MFPPSLYPDVLKKWNILENRRIASSLTGDIMNRCLRFIALLLIAALSLWLGITPEAGFDHVWLFVALVVLLKASEARYWDPSRLRH